MNVIVKLSKIIKTIKIEINKHTHTHIGMLNTIVCTLYHSVIIIM